MIVAARVTQSAADVHELLPMQCEAEQDTGRSPKHLLADAGYKSEANFVALEERGIDGCVSLGRREETREKVKNAGPATARMARKLETKRGRRRHVRSCGTSTEEGGPVFLGMRSEASFRGVCLPRCLSSRSHTQKTGSPGTVAVALAICGADS